MEARLGARLFNRTSRKLALTDTGRTLADASRRHSGGRGSSLESEALSQVRPNNLGGLLAAEAVPMSFGVSCTSAPLLPEFFRNYPEISIDFASQRLAQVDIVGPRRL